MRLLVKKKKAENPLIDKRFQKRFMSGMVALRRAFILNFVLQKVTADVNSRYCINPIFLI